jgi:REP element-mobilizing transposase RayT
MTRPKPIYSLTNCTPAYQLNWSLSVFWREPQADAHWLPDLQRAAEPDGVRILEHRFAQPSVSQFLVSTTPAVSPQQFARSVKGRLQHLVRDAQPRAFRRNYAFRSVGSAKRDVVARYVASQHEHHPMADARVQERLKDMKISRSGVDLSAPQSTGHARFWYNLHVVLVRGLRRSDIQADTLSAERDMVARVAEKKGHQLSEASVLSDHVHLLLGCGVGDAPGDVALAYMNNIAFVRGRKPVFEFSFYAGTVGEYDLGATRR